MRIGRASERDVVGPLSLVFAHVAWEGASHREESAAERAAAELDRRYPEGVAGLRAGYVARRRALLCVGFPRESGDRAIAWTAAIPRGPRLRRRAVVIRRFPDSIGYACLRRGVPVNVGGIALRDAPAREDAGGEAPVSKRRPWPRRVAPPLTPEQRERVRTRLPEAFSAAPWYLLTGRRRLSRDPALSGVRRPRPGRGLPAALNLVGVAALLVAVATATGARAGTQAGARAGTQAASRAGPSVEPGVASSPDLPMSEAAPDAAAALSALAVVVEPLTPRLEVSELHAEGAALRVRGRRGGAEDVRVGLSSVQDFEDVTIVSRHGAGFVIEARYRGGPGPAAEAGQGHGSDGPGPGARAAAVLDDAGFEEVAFDRLDAAAGGQGRYRVSGEAGPGAVAAAVSEFAAGGPGVLATVLSLSRLEGDRWRMTSVVSGGDAGEE